MVGARSEVAPLSKSAGFASNSNRALKTSFRCRSAGPIASVRIFIGLDASFCWFGLDALDRVPSISAGNPDNAADSSDHEGHGAKNN